MFYALLIVCLASAPECDLDNAVWAQQSPPIFESNDGCVRGAMSHLHEVPIPQLKENTEYQIDVECTKAVLPSERPVA
jgi:hypothetical protein